ncbi:MAG: DUF4189 domain-containing protein [Hyphomicrobiales bacterium]|nr:MAG: DUF4189 domain-containing protein [Hyphomicrobiales bacterium]
MSRVPDARDVARRELCRHGSEKDRGYKDRMRALRGMAFALAVAAAAGWVVPAHAQAEIYFGAISYSPSTGATGWGTDFPTREGAAAASQRNCRQYADDCEVVTWFKDGCGALAANAEDFESAWSPSKDDAEQRALRRCRASGRGCTVIRWVCTTNSFW